MMTTSYPQVLYTPSVSNTSSPAPHVIPPLIVYRDGRAGKDSDNFELNHH